MTIYFIGLDLQLRPESRHGEHDVDIEDIGEPKGEPEEGAEAACCRHLEETHESTGTREETKGGGLEIAAWVGEGGGGLPSPAHHRQAEDERRGARRGGIGGALGGGGGGGNPSEERVGACAQVGANLINIFFRVYQFGASIISTCSGQHKYIFLTSNLCSHVNLLQ